MQKSFLVLLICLSMSSCKKDLSVAKSASATFFFSDRSDASLEYIYAINDSRVVASVGNFPSSSHLERTLYQVTLENGGLRTETEFFESAEADIKPPFPPGGPWFSRWQITLPDATPTAYFSNENARAKKWFDDLRRRVVSEKNRISALPPDLESNCKYKESLFP